MFYFGTGLGQYVPVLAYIACWVLCLLALSGRPLLSFYFTLPLLPYRALRDKFGGYPLGGNLLTILVIVTIIGALLHGKRLPKTKLYLVWFVFAIYLYFSMWLGTGLGNAPAPLWLGDDNFVTWKDYLLIPLVFVAAGLVIEDRKSLRTTLIIIALSLLLIDKSALANSMSRSWVHFSEDKRDGGPLAFAGSNGLAAFLAQFSFFFWGLLLFVKNKRHRLLGYALVGITLFATMYTFSRAAYLASVVGVVLLGILKDRKLLPLAAVFLFTWQIVVPTAVSERVNMTQNSSGQLEASAQERVKLWTDAKDAIVHSPIFGMGFGTYQYGFHYAYLKDTHNWYVKVMIETGIVGAMIALVMIAMLLALPFQLFRKAQDPLYKGLGLGLFLAVFCNLILNCFGDRWTYLEINGLLWVLAAAAARALMLTDTEQEAPEPASVEPLAAVNPYMAYH
jgi:putative inorganic carbon (hco3(-)) transporter